MNVLKAVRACAKDHLRYFNVSFRMKMPPWVVRGFRLCFTDPDLAEWRRKQGEKPSDPLPKQRAERKSMRVVFTDVLTDVAESNADDSWTSPMTNRPTKQNPSPRHPRNGEQRLDEGSTANEEGEGRQ